MGEGDGYFTVTLLDIVLCAEYRCLNFLEGNILIRDHLLQLLIELCQLDHALLQTMELALTVLDRVQCCQCLLTSCLLQQLFSDDRVKH